MLESVTFSPNFKSIFTGVGGRNHVKRHGQLAQCISDLFVRNMHREDILRIFVFCTAGLFFEVLHVGVSYINMSNVCFWRRSSSNQEHKQGFEVLVVVVYISVLGLKQDLALKNAALFSVLKKKKNQ